MENVQNVILVVHLVLALLLIGVVLLQRSEGGGLGMGGGGGGGVMTGRQAANALSKVTWVFAAGFIATSVTLTVLAAQSAKDTSVVDTVAGDAPAKTETPLVPADTSGLLATPPAATDEPVVPPVSAPLPDAAPVTAPEQSAPVNVPEMPALPGGVSPYSSAPASN